MFAKFKGEKSKIFLDEFTEDVCEEYSDIICYQSEEAPVPATLLTRCRYGEFEILERIEVSLNRVLHGEQTYEVYHPLKKGNKIKYQTELADAYSKKGKGYILNFLIFESAIHIATDSDELDGEKIALSRSNFIIRSKE